MPTNRSGWLPKSSRASTALRSAGPSLPAQPAALHRAVKRTSSSRPALLSLRFAIGDGFCHASSRVSAGRTEPAQVADAGGDAAMIEKVEQRDRELARCAQQITIDGSADFRAALEMLQQAGARLVEPGAIEVEIGRDLHHPPLALHRSEQRTELADFRSWKAEL